MRIFGRSQLEPGVRRRRWPLRRVRRRQTGLRSAPGSVAPTIASAPFRAFGIRPSRMNPNTCTICEMMFSRMMKARQVTIDATVLFADLRGYTGLSQSQSAVAVSKVLDAFYDECAEAIWDHDGLLNKTMGDAVMAIFNFPIRRDDHPIQAVLAARAIQDRWKTRRDVIAEAGSIDRQDRGRRRH